MYESITIENLGGFKHFEWKDISAINVLIGKNDTGKTHLLKVLYSVAKSLEEYSKQSKPDIVQESFNTILANKILWTFQPNAIGEIVTKRQSKLKVDTRLCNENYHFSFTHEATRKITDCSPNIKKIDNLQAFFIPPKEVITAFDAIAATREQLEIFGFDDTYFDLIKALRLPTTKGNLQKDMKQVLNDLEMLFSGEIVREDNQFIFKRGRDKFLMPQVAEGIKKIGILTTLIRNRTLSKGTILFMDEPETNLHPEAIIALVKMLFSLSKAGIQIYIATHSYFVIKQFELLSRANKQRIQICSLVKEGGDITTQFQDLQEGLPDNPIIEASIQLYEDDVKLGLV
jgi:AAA15 family ATPase/GTPase